MRNIFLKIICVILTHFVAGYSLGATKKTLSLVEYGINKSTSSKENFKIMQKIHLDALKFNCTVDYSGLDSLEIEICEDAEPIPIPNGCDFKKLKLKVINRVKNFELFIIKSRPRKIHVTPAEIDCGNFENIQELEKGIKLVAIVDSTPWIEERVGYGYSHYRRDIMLVKNGYTENLPLQAYSDSVSRPFARYVDIEKKPIVVSNLEIIRSNVSTFKTTCFSVDYQYNLHFKNISIITPDSDLYGDRAINVTNSMNINFKDIFISGTYSQIDKWGYGIGFNNVRQSKFERLYADGKWGIFGNNNISNINIVDSDINRFDVHCYGKDVNFTNTVFRKLGNAVSSFFGKIKFDRCKFIDFKPIVIRDSYRINTKFDVIFDGCFMEWTKPGVFPITSTGKSIGKNSLRPKLEFIDWPNLFITNTSIKSFAPQSTLCLFNSMSELPVTLNSNLDIKIDGLIIDGFKDILICNRKIESTEGCSVNVKTRNTTLDLKDTD